MKKVAKIFATIGLIINIPFCIIIVGIVPLIFNIMALKKLKADTKPSVAFTVLYLIFGNWIAALFILLSKPSEYEAVAVEAEAEVKAE